MLAPRAGASLTVAALGVSLTGCGSSSAAPSPAVRGTCPASALRIDRSVAARVVREASSGRVVTGSAVRISRSRALTKAVASDDPAAVAAALRPLLRSRVQRIVVVRSGHVLAEVGRVAALGPVGGALRDPGGRTVGTFTLATGKDAGIARFVHGLTGAQVVVRAGSRTLASTLRGPVPALPSAGIVRLHARRYTVSSFAATAFPSGRLRISVLAPPAGRRACAGGAAQAKADALGAVAERLFDQERRSRRTRNVVSMIAHDPRFAHAVATDDPSALRGQIVRFFRDPALHVVRIRAVTASGALVNDVGGPYVLAPASAAVRLHGRIVGRVTASIQDDAGYIKLLRRFTGAQVLLRTAPGQVPGSSVSPGPARLPARGTVRLQGRPYRVFSFDAEAFPSGPLRVSLLVA